MSNEAPKDGAQDTPENKATPMPKLEGTSEAQRSDGDVVAAVEKLLDDRLEKYRRNVQSMVDKQLAGVSRQEEGSDLDEYDRLIGEGLTPKEARQELRLRRTESNVQRLAQGRAKVSDEPSAQTFDFQKILKEVGIDPTQPEAQPLMSGTYKDEADFERQALRLKLKLSQSNTPSPAGSPATSTTGASAPGQGDPRIAQLAELQKNPAVNRFAIKKLKDELDKDGWPD